MGGFIGFLIFMGIFMSGFWILIFLSAFAPYWLLGGLVQSLKPKNKS